MKPATVVFDLGSSSLRCTIYDDATLAVLSHASNDRRTVEFDGSIAMEGLMDEVDHLLDQVLQSATSRECTVSAIGFSCFAMNLVGVDGAGDLVPQATMSYASHSHASCQELIELRKLIGNEALHELYRATGTPLHTSYALAHLRNPSVTAVKTWQTIASRVVSRWCAAKSPLPITYGEASWTGLLNLHTCEYEAKLQEYLPNTDALPPIIPPHQPLAVWEDCNIAEGYLKRWPSIQKDAKLFGGIPDGIGANLGSKCTDASRIAVTVGTSAAARVIVQGDVTIPPGLFGYRIDESHVLLGGALSDGGSVMEWVSELLHLGDFESPEFQQCLKDAETALQKAYDKGTSSVSMVPFLSGERSTGFRDYATGAMIGLTRETSRADFLLSCMGGVVLRLNAIIQLIQSVVSDVTCIVISGKALESNALWRKMLADCTGLSVIYDDTTAEGTSRGVARLISPSHDAFQVEDLVIASCTEPEETSYWEDAVAKQSDLIQSLFR